MIFPLAPFRYIRPCVAIDVAKRKDQAEALDNESRNVLIAVISLLANDGITIAIFPDEVVRDTVADKGMLRVLIAVKREDKVWFRGCCVTV